ncbi:MAG: hypothetical protein IIA72_16235 [Proteobacteria bacterium]|nr:hypothetical protein [Pseudomonadota bacterium]
MRQGGGQTKKQRGRILVLRSIAGYLVVPGLAANIFVWSGYDFSRSDTYDNEFMSWTLLAAFGFSVFAYI